MKTRDEVSAEKLRGGFYTPPSLVSQCYRRIRELLGEARSLRLLEPSIGDGAFVRGLSAEDDLAARIVSFDGIEVVGSEADRARAALESAGLPVSVTVTSALAWAATTDDWFDAAVGNPPFVRYQFLSGTDKALLPALGDRLGIRLPGVGNIWIPVFLGALSRLRKGGAFAFVIPTECFTGCSAEVARQWLTRRTADLRFDLFPPGSFPDVLQEVAVVSGRRVEAAGAAATVTLVEHGEGGTARRWGYPLRTGDRTWTRHLLDPAHLGAVTEAVDRAAVRHLRDVAKLEVSIVTGANDFFCVSDGTASEYGLEDWIEPLLPRAKHAPGLRYTESDHGEVRGGGGRCWLLDFSSARPDPARHSGATRYLGKGAAIGLPARYKCRIRDPWYRVPSIRAAPLLLSKRSHLYPKLILNEAGSLTTDTIYRGDVLPGAEVSGADLVSSFHSSLTLLSAELEGRSFGGGVLELVPTEVGRLSVVAQPGFARHLPGLDRLARQGDPEELVRQTDALLVRDGILSADVVALLAEARELLLARRLGRNRVAAPPALAA